MKKNRGGILKILYGLLMYSFLYIPIIVLIAFSFNESKLNVTWTGFTLKWYRSLLENQGILVATKNSFIIALVSSVFAVIIGTLAAVGMYKYKFKGRSLLEGLLYIPVIIPEIVLGISLLTFFSYTGIPLGMVTLILAHITFSIAYVVSTVKTRLDDFDKSVEEAARDLGATETQTFFKITLPIIMPGVMAGALLSFTLSLDDMIISFFAAGPESVTLPLKIFSMVKFGVTPEINALSTLMLLFTLIIILLSALLRNNQINMKKVGAILLSITVCVLFISGGILKFVKGPSEEKRELNVFNWSEYLPQSVIDKFEERYNCKVNYSTFSSNEEMLAKIMAGGSNYDLAVASDYMVEILKKQNLIEPINKNKLSNIGNLGDEFMNLPFDRGNEYSIPYMWLAGIIGVDSSKVDPSTITSYDDLWKPEFKNSLVVLDDERVIIGLTLKSLGYSLNETSPEALEKAKEKLIKLKPNIKAYDSDSPKTMLINGEAKAIFAWGAESSLAKRENKNIQMVLPKEGLFLQQDNFVIPKGAKNNDLAHEFINFILEPEISAEISEAFPYGNPNKAAYPLIDPDIIADKAVYPPSEEVKKGEYLKDIGDKIKIFDDIWTSVKQEN
ncbi:extracellular solute-binding protein [Clostridium paridis]|uniref:Extracellular solute-binding protein n=1 Tax=Clostridium paridis TaxID=2803863 RepID=A0A937FIV7_9CLOT|nr:extracellular solute-binding protein [Clostridium paridis]MBL4932461.1 extracellular solute-binding protein [Clostridium paridis]